jgi:hypothetical protein
MGLDMYLTASEYVSNYNWAGAEPVPNPAYGSLLEAVQAKNIWQKEIGSGISVELPMGYWRKANAIHGWFVRELADGVDECQSIFVPQEKLQELLDLCKQVKADHNLAPELLPHTQGFFFGSYEYDDWYFSDIDLTIEICENALASGYGYFTYQASW